MLDRSQEKFPREINACHVIKSVSGTQIRKKIGVHSRKRVLGNIGSFRSGKEANRAGPRRVIERVEASLEQHIAPKLTAETRTHVLPHSPVGQELRGSLAEWFWVRVSPEVTVETLVRAAVTWRPVGNSRSAHRRAHYRGCWREAAVLTT